MIRKVLLPTLAVLGAAVALGAVFWTQKKTPAPAIPFPPPRSPYIHPIYGQGIVEASSRNLSIGSPFNAVVTDVFVIEGDYVQAGDPLFELDIRTYDAEAEEARNEIRAAIVNFENQRKQLSFYERLVDRRAVSEQQYQQTYYAFREAEEQLRVAKSKLSVVEANIDRSLVRAPIEGEILQVNIHIGEVAPNVAMAASQLLIPYASSQYPLVLMGSVAPLQMRVDIDQEDAWRFVKGSEAMAFVRGNSKISFPMRFVRIEPYIVPKASFTGETTERIDTRVFQVLYEFNRKDLPIYAGQVLDVYIKTQDPE
jgi:HlyD family secretion protein